jgi:hypothetical protein
MRVVCSTRGTVNHQEWPFSYRSWAEAAGKHTARYFYEFTNQSSKNVPVRWRDAGIVRPTTPPGKPIGADFTGLLPAEERPSTIEVGPEGASSFKVSRLNCFGRQAPEQSAGRISEATFRFAGTVVDGQGRLVELALEFTSRLAAAMIRYTIERQDTLLPGRTLFVVWSAPRSAGLASARPEGLAERTVLAWANVEARSTKLGETEAIILDERGSVIVRLLPRVLLPWEK